ncbi:MAG: hypothetical protein A2252_07335 [Elusimicrobia bacterium RIFOXYA2_FULL_39_19]|nr:MAG: hypothetical protein A2252_07335 [Elusimicrobia bacterium RIFOXYA2_FULL_39_19]
MKNCLITILLVFLSISFSFSRDSNYLSFSSTSISLDQTVDISTPTFLQPTYNKEILGLLEDLKNNKINTNIVIYYIEKTIIKEAPQDEYLTHLLQALKDNLKKGKKEGIVRRVEKDLVEIDKGSIHKVRERDLYKVYDSTTGGYKGVLEVQAIADAVSIGKNYDSKTALISSNDKIVYCGQRKIFGFGPMIGGSVSNTKDYTKEPFDFEKGANPNCVGLLMEWTFSRAWSIQWLLGQYIYSKNIPTGFWDSQNKYIRKNDAFSFELDCPLTIKKKLFYPSWFSPNYGLGVGYFKSSFETSHNYNDYLNGMYVIEKNDSAKNAYCLIYPAFGIELFSSNLVHVIFDAKYIYPLVPLRGTTEDHSWSGWIFSTGMTTNW